MVTLCTLRAATVLSRNCCADFGCPFTKEVMPHSHEGPGVTEAIAGKHCTCHWSVASSPFRYPPLKIPEISCFDFVFADPIFWERINSQRTLRTTNTQFFSGIVWGFCLCVFSPIRNDPQKIHTQMFAPQSLNNPPKSVYVLRELGPYILRDIAEIPRCRNFFIDTE